MDNNEILYKTLDKEEKLLIKKITMDREKINNLISQQNELQEKLDIILHEKEMIIVEKNRIEEQLNTILYSRSYKITQKIKKFLRR